MLSNQKSSKWNESQLVYSVKFQYILSQMKQNIIICIYGDLLMESKMIPKNFPRFFFPWYTVGINHQLLFFFDFLIGWTWSLGINWLKKIWKFWLVYLLGGNSLIFISVGPSYYFLGLLLFFHFLVKSHFKYRNYTFWRDKAWFNTKNNNIYSFIDQSI